MCASWAVAPPSSLIYQSSKQLVPSQPVHPALRPQGEGPAHWEDSISLCVLVQPGEADSQLAVAHIPALAGKRGVFLVVGAHRSSEFCFPLTTVDGRRPDDISVGVLKRQHSCFRSLFEGESCPAPFTHGSQFYCFHCLGREPALSRRSHSQAGAGHQRPAVPLQPSAALCSQPETVKRRHAEEDGRQEEKLALMYERLRVEVRTPVAIRPGSAVPSEGASVHRAVWRCFCSRSSFFTCNWTCYDFLEGVFHPLQKASSVVN